MAAGGQEGGQCRTDQSRGAGHGHGHGRLTPRPPPGVGGQVLGQLALAESEHCPQQRRRYRRAYLVVDPGGSVPGLAEAMRVPPTEQVEGHGRYLVHEGVGRVVTVAAVLGHPPQPAGEGQYRLAVPQRARLADHFPGQPRRRKPGQGAGPGVPGEHLAQRCLDDAGALKAHNTKLGGRPRLAGPLCPGHEPVEVGAHGRGPSPQHLAGQGAHKAGAPAP